MILNCRLPRSFKKNEAAYIRTNSDVSPTKPQLLMLINFQCYHDMWKKVSKTAVKPLKNCFES
jgi:hypothetical protein